MKEIRWGIIGCGNVTEVKSGPAFQKAEGSRLVAVMRRDGAIGELRTVITTHLSRPGAQDLSGSSASWRVKPELSGGGYFYDLASHTLDLLDYLLGPIASAHGFASNQAGLYEAEDIVMGSYRFESGVHGTGTWCFSSDAQVDRNEIVGSKGRIVFSTFGEAPIRLVREQGAEECVIEHPAHIQQPLIQSIVDELRGKGGVRAQARRRCGRAA